MSTAAQEEFNALFADKNRISRHPEDEADSTSDADDTPAEPTYYQRDSEDDDDLDNVDTTRPTSSSASNMRSRYFLPKQRSEANTGPKGVIADAQAFNEAKAKRFSFRAARKLPQSVYQRYASNNHTAAESVIRDPEKSPDDDDEDEFLDTWRQTRLKELQQPTSRRMSALGASRGHSPPGGGRRAYGSLVAVDGEGYLDAIEKVAANTVVVVFIYDDLVRFFYAFVQERLRLFNF